MSRRDVNFIVQNLSLQLDLQTALLVRFLAPELDVIQVDSTASALTLVSEPLNLFNISLNNFGNMDSEVIIFDGPTRELFNIVVPSRGSNSGGLTQGHIGCETNLRIEKDNIMDIRYTVLKDDRFTDPT